MATRAPDKVSDALSAAVDALAAAGVESPRLDAELLLAEAGGWERAYIAAHPEAGLPAAAGRRFGELVRRRLRREPVAYILGRKGFRHLELAVDRRVLIPRPETELLVELALELAPRRVLDVGTGSGAIALAIADEIPECQVTAMDVSPAALEVARANAERLGLAERVELTATLPSATQGEPPPAASMRPAAQHAFDLVVANLPYVADGDWASLQPEVTRWEPREALLAGPDGLDAYRALLGSGRGSSLNRIAAQIRTAPEAAQALTPEVAQAVAFEVGDGQARAVGDLLREAGFGKVESRRDLAGIERVVWGSR